METQTDNEDSAARRSVVDNLVLSEEEALKEQEKSDRHMDTPSDSFNTEATSGPLTMSGHIEDADLEIRRLKGVHSGQPRTSNKEDVLAQVGVLSASKESTPSSKGVSSSTNMSKRIKEYTDESQPPHAPPTQLERQSVVSQSEPGAYAAAPGEAWRRNSDLSSSAVRRTSQIAESLAAHADSIRSFLDANATDDSTDGMPVDGAVGTNRETNTDIHPVALPVDEENPQDIAPSKQVNLEEKAAADALQKRKMMFVFGLGFLFVVAVIIMVVALVGGFEGGNNSANSSSTAAAAGTTTEVPTPSPTTPQDQLLALLPDSTILAIEKDDTSPQARAFQWFLADPNNHEEYNGARLVQRFVLATLFFATDGEEWDNKDGWLSYEVDECQWEIVPNTGLVWDTSLKAWANKNASELVGVSPCNDNGVYERLWLFSNGLKGRLPLELFLLTDMVQIDLSANNDLKGALPPEVGQLTTLELLDLRNNAHTGSLPTEIGLMKALSILELHTNALTGPIPCEVGQMENLGILRIFVNQLSGSLPSEIGLLHSELHLFNLYGNSLTGTLPTQLGNLAAMEDFHLEENQLTGTIISEFGNLDKMYHLFLYTNQLTGAIPSELGRCGAMDEIEIEDNKLTGALPSELGLLPMGYFYGVYNQLTGTIPSEFGGLTAMRDMWLGYNELTGTLPTELGLLSQLEGLILDKNQLTGSIPMELGFLATRGALVGLNLKENDLTGTVPLGVCWLDDGLSNKTFPPEVTWHQSAESFVEFDCRPPVLCGCSCNCSGHYNDSNPVSS